jgi:hypothetical protein
MITRFEDYADESAPYIYHCHLLRHEDDGLMGQFLVVDGGAAHQGLTEHLTGTSSKAASTGVTWARGWPLC